MGTKKQILENQKRKSDNFCCEDFVNHSPCIHQNQPSKGQLAGRFPSRDPLTSGFRDKSPGSKNRIPPSPFLPWRCLLKPIMSDLHVAFTTGIPDIKWSPKIIPKESKLACSSNKTPRSLHGMSPKCHDTLPYSSNSAPGLPRGLK